MPDLSCSAAKEIPPGIVLYQSAENLGWEWQNPLPTGNRLWDVDFVDTNHGWIVGEHGTILRTSDAGRSWNLQQSLGPLNLFRIRFTEELTGFILAYEISHPDQGIIFKTTDGGHLWQKQQRVTDGLTTMTFIDPAHGWVAGGQDNTGKPVAAGVYLYRLETSKAAQIRKMILLR